MVDEHEYEYDFAISVSGQNRDTANNLEKLLSQGGAKVFYDRNFEDHLLGKNFPAEWKNVCKTSRFLIVIVSEYYVEGDWTQFEFEVGKNEELKRETEFILPLLLDSSTLPGLPYTTSHIDLRHRKITEAAAILLKKLKIVPESRPAGQNKKRLDDLSNLITSEQIAKFNEIRKNEIYSTLDLRHLDLGGDRKLNGKLRPLRLENIILKKSFLNQSDLSGIRIKNSDLSYSTYYLANLSESRLENVNFSNSFMQQADLYSCFMRNCDFSNSNFSIANLFDARFSECCIYRANFSYAKCNNTSFVKCVLFAVYFNNANVSEASFDSSLLLNITNFKNLTCLNASFTNALINNEEFVVYLRSQGAKDVPDALTDIQEIRRRLIQMSCWQEIIDKILQELH